MKTKQTICIVLGLLIGHSVWAIDSALYERYNAYKSRQQTKQVEELGRARSAALDGDFSAAEQHLEAARNMAYSPDEIRTVETLIANERERRERLAREERERKERLAEEARQKSERLAVEPDCGKWVGHSAPVQQLLPPITGAGLWAPLKRRAVCRNLFRWSFPA